MENSFKIGFIIFDVVFLVFGVFVLIYGLNYFNNEFNRIEENCKNYFNVDSCEFVRYNGEFIALPEIFLKNNSK